MGESVKLAAAIKDAERELRAFGERLAGLDMGSEEYDKVEVNWKAGNERLMNLRKRREESDQDKDRLQKRQKMFQGKVLRLEKELGDHLEKSEMERAVESAALRKRAT